jgi:hypothetical protein
MKISGVKLFSIIVTAVIVVLIVIALFLVGSPENERQRRFDEQRIQDLQQIRFNSIDAFYRENERLPDSLQETRAATPMRGMAFLDPVTEDPYEYTRVSSSTYELCAVFDMPSESEMIKSDPFWEHGAGHTCFTLDIQSRSESPMRSVPVMPREEY